MEFWVIPLTIILLGIDWKELESIYWFPVPFIVILISEFTVNSLNKISLEKNIEIKNETKTSISFFILVLDFF